MKKAQVTIYTCNDGEQFDDEGEALAHETMAEAQVKVDKYINSLNPENPRTATRIRNVILGWEAYNAQLFADQYKNLPDVMEKPSVVAVVAGKD